MKRIFLALFLIGAAATAEAGSKWHKTFDAAQKEAKQKNQLIFVDLFADWCGWCHRMEREVFPSEAFQQASEDLVLLRLDTEDRGEGTRISQELGVHSLPTFVIVTSDMTIAGLISGYSPPAQFVVHLHNQRKKYAEFQKELASEPKASPEKRLELAQALVSRRAYALAEQKLTALVAAKPAKSVADSANYNLAVSQLALKKHAAAEKTIDGALKTKPTNADQLTYLKAHVYLESQNYPAALRELKSFRSKHPKSELVSSVDRMIPQVEFASRQKK